MTLYTSHYDNYGKAPTPIAISVGVPKFFEGRIYARLAPTWKLENAYQNGEIDEQAYTDAYLRLLAQRSLTPASVIRDLPFHATLMCWEKPYRFCHRHIVAKWIQRATGIVIKEYGTRFIGGGLGINL